MNVLLALRIPKNLLVLPLEVVLLYFGMKMVLKIYMALLGRQAMRVRSKRIRQDKKAHPEPERGSGCFSVYRLPFCAACRAGAKVSPFGAAETRCKPDCAADPVRDHGDPDADRAEANCTAGDVAAAQTQQHHGGDRAEHGQRTSLAARSALVRVKEIGQNRIAGAVMDEYPDAREGKRFGREAVDPQDERAEQHAQQAGAAQNKICDPD